MLFNDALKITNNEQKKKRRSFQTTFAFSDFSAGRIVNAAGRIVNAAGVRVNATAARVNRAGGKVNAAGHIVNRPGRIVFPAGRIANRPARNVIRSLLIVFNNRSNCDASCRVER